MLRRQATTYMWRHVSKTAPICGGVAIDLAQ
jgi:hypothetical protein